MSKKAKRHMWYKGYEVSEVKNGKSLARHLPKQVKQAFKILKKKGAVQVERDDSPEGYAAHEILRDVAGSIGLEMFESGHGYILTILDNPKSISAQ